MKKKLLITLSLLGLFSIGGCTSAYTGMDGNNMYTNTHLDVAVVPGQGLVPFRSESTFTEIDTNANLGARAHVNYAIYGNPGNGPVTQHGHVLFTTFSDTRKYVFQPETFGRTTDLAVEVKKINDREWRVHTLYEDGNSDWFSKVWRENGRETPKTWIGKRFTRTFNTSTRVVAEYREPLPECARIEKVNTGIVFLNSEGLSVPTEECRREVDAILERADNAFDLVKASDIEITGKVPANILTNMPKSAMDGTRYIGTAILNDSIMLN